MQNKTSAAEGGKAASRDSSLPPCFRQVPPNTQRGIALSVLSVCLSVSLSRTGKDVQVQLDQGLPGSPAQAHFSLQDKNVPLHRARGPPA